MDFEKEMLAWLDRCGFQRNSENWEDYSDAKRKYFLLEEANPDYYWPKYNEFIKILTDFLYL